MSQDDPHVRDLERMIRIKDDLVGELSHELRAPLHAILGWAEIVLARSALSEDDRRAMEAIARNARIQARVIDDAVELNRVIGGKLRLDKRRTDLQSALAMALELARPAADAKHVTLTESVDGIAGTCDVDPERLQQILGAMLAYGIKAAPVNSEVVASLRHVGAALELAVSMGDAVSTGLTPGALEAAQPIGKRERHGGVGLGLALARSLAELHDGTLRLERTGDATTALVARLPVRVPAILPSDEAAPAMRSVRAIAPGTRGGSDVRLDGVTVLVVDDDGDARDLVQQILNDAHARAVTAASADEGLAILRDVKPDLIISDIGMAMRDGYQFMRLVRTMASADGGTTPALALTAFVQTEDRTRALLAGYQEHISKPVEARQLVAAVHRLARPAAASPAA